MLNIGECLTNGTDTQVHKNNRKLLLLSTIQINRTSYSG